MIMRESRLVVATRLGWPGVRLGFPGLRGLGSVGPMPSTIPSSIGFPDYQSFYNAATGSLPDCTNQGFPDSACVAAKQDYINRVNAEWTGNPNNCHAVVCNAAGQATTTPVTATAASAAPATKAVQSTSPTTSTTQSQATTAVQAGSTASTATTGSTADPFSSGYSTTTGTTTTTTTGNAFVDFLTGSILGGIPNWVLIGGGTAVLILLMQHGGRR